jgi:putative ABC transport system ATP-binding protein
MDLCRHYHRGRHIIKAVDGVDLNLARGDFLAVVGASGSGKSTLLNLLAGLDSPTSGVIKYTGRTLTDMSRKELSAYRAARVGMIFQSFNLLPYQTAHKNVELALYFRDISRRERLEKTNTILRRLGLENRMDHRPGDLSGGEQQRVAIARALVKSPEILFADEPTGNLDQENTDAIADLLTEFNREGLTIILVTHDLELARRCAGRILRMHYGSIMDGSSSQTERNNETP